MSTLEIDFRGLRRARVRSMIQLAGLLEKSGILETFQITLGLDLQKDETMKNNIAALFKGFLVLNEIANSEDTNIPLWANQGLAILANSKKR
ncbi:MAG: hypothetical protein JNJ47_02165 [Alphaproteobacteria bacterium]|nr:hypothetical protein [Alphaproteobacteria bacterium]